MRKIALAVLLLLAIPCVYAGPIGEIKVCRRLHIQELMDGKRVLLQSMAEPGSANGWGSYTGACDSDGDNCRSITVVAKRNATLGPSKRSCVRIPAELTQADGKPLSVGTHLLPQWSIPGLTPVVTVSRAFK